MEEFKEKKNKMHGSGLATLIIPNKEMNDIMEIVHAPEDSNILLKGVTKTVEKETKEQKGGFSETLLDTLGASFLGKMLTGKGILRTGYGKMIFRADYGSKIDF